MAAKRRSVVRRDCPDIVVAPIAGWMSVETYEFGRRAHMLAKVFIIGVVVIASSSFAKSDSMSNKYILACNSSITCNGDCTGANIGCRAGCGGNNSGCVKACDDQSRACHANCC